MKLDLLYHQECLLGMQRLPNQSIDMILCDLPYGTTANKWDSVIPLDLLWAQYKRVVRPGAAIVLTAQAPFDKLLAHSNLKWFRYEWIWEKTIATGHLNAHRAPLKAHENVLVFCEKGAPYRPQGLVRLIRPIHRQGGKRSTNYGKHDRPSVQKFSHYPRSVLHFPSQGRTIHPTQKPVALFEYLIRTYTNPGEIVLDNCMGSGTTAIAALNTGRHYIGFEQDAGYYAKAQVRIAAHHQNRNVSSLQEAA